MYSDIMNNISAGENPGSIKLSFFTSFIFCFITSLHDIYN